MKDSKLEALLQSLKEQNTGAEDSLAVLDRYVSENPASDEALLRRGMLHWQLGNRAEAINDYNAALRINPESPAKIALKQTYSILDFYDKDLLNP